MSPGSICQILLAPRVLVPLICGAIGLSLVGMVVASSADSDQPSLPRQVSTTLEPGDNFVGWVAEPLKLDQLFAEIPEIELVYRWDARVQRYEFALPGISASSRPLAIVEPQTTAEIAIGNRPLRVDELFRAAPNIDVIYSWDATTRRWSFAIRYFPSKYWSLDVIEPNTTATIRTGSSPLSTAALFEDAPQIVSVSRHDRDSDTYAYAFNGLAEASGDLAALQPGMGVVIRLGGDEPVEWTRPTVPAAGLVELRTGVNWAGWLGPDDWAITDVARGIGRFLSEIRLGDHVYDPASPETADNWPTVSRGDALIVTVKRGINWLQPTYVEPKLIFTGSVNQGIRNDVKRDLADMMAFNAEAFGVQADPFRLVIIIPGDVRSLFNELERLGNPWDWESLRSWWQRSGGRGGADFNINRADFWTRNQGRYSVGRYVLLEEYFHAIQYQLAGDALDLPPTWMVEGSVNWIRADVETNDRTGYPLSRRLIDARNRASQGPPLEDVEEGNQTWQYSFGLVAADLLVERDGVATMLDFFRAFAPGRTGANGQWESQLSWEGAFAATYGISVDEFYAEFEAMMHRYRGDVPRRPEPGQVRMRGTVVDRNGEPRSQVRVKSFEIENDAFATFGTAQARSDEDGEFTLFVKRNADHRIWVELSDDWRCMYWWTSDGDNEAQLAENADLIEVGASDPSPLTITTDPDKCRWRISGQLIGPDGGPLAGIQVQARSDGVAFWTPTGQDGSFELVATGPGEHTLSADLGGCRTYWRSEGPTHRLQDAEKIGVFDAHVTNIRFEVREDTCLRITGRILDSDGSAVDDVQVSAMRDEGSVWSLSDPDGSFRIAVPGSGAYRVRAWIDGCGVYYSRDGATGSPQNATQVEVSDTDVVGINIQLLPGMCELRISGRLLNADGTPRANQWVSAWSAAGSGGGSTDGDGRFSFAVPGSNSYILNVWIDDCAIYRGDEGPTTDWTASSDLNVANRDVTGVVFRLPEDPGSFCD